MKRHPPSSGQIQGTYVDRVLSKVDETITHTQQVQSSEWLMRFVVDVSYVVSNPLKDQDSVFETRCVDVASIWTGRNPVTVP